jgi:hypothetical protein
VMRVAACCAFAGDANTLSMCLLICAKELGIIQLERRERTIVLPMQAFGKLIAQ